MKTNTFGELDGKGMRIAVVAARFNQTITDRLVAGAEAAMDVAGVAKNDCLIVRVPGSFELPQVAAAIAKKGGYDAIVCLGCLIKGETDHDVFIAEAVAEGLQHVSLQYGLPVLFGVLTCRTKEQAEARAEGLAEKNKGYEAVLSAIETVQAFRMIEL
jgi:6,7-dimethyl-8-ribityllumazine synthase